jgi:hypothetical protein
MLHSLNYCIATSIFSVNPNEDPCDLVIPATFAESTDYDPRKDPKWQDRYFEDFRPAFAERLFWVSDGKPIPPLTNNPRLKKTSAKGKKKPAAKKKTA